MDKSDKTILLMDKSDKTILLIEDNKILRKYNAKFLENEGYIVFTEFNGADAIEKIESGLEYNLLITDMSLNSSRIDSAISNELQFDGGDIIETSKKLHPNIPILVITGYNKKHPYATKTLIKGYNSKDLVICVNDILERRTRYS